MRVFICLLCLLLTANVQGFVQAQESGRDDSLNNGRVEGVPPPVIPQRPSRAEIVAKTSPDNYLPAEDRTANLELSLLLRSSKVQREIELTREQYTSIQKIQTKMEKDTEQLRHQLQKLNVEARTDGPDNDKNAKAIAVDAALLQDELMYRHATFCKQAKDVLLPHQQKSLSQIATQLQVLKTSAPNQPPLLNEILVDKLGLSSEQLDEMQKVSDESDEKLKEIIAAHLESKHESMLELLTPEQREKFDEIYGTKIDF